MQQSSSTKQQIFLLLILVQYVTVHIAQNASEVATWLQGQYLKNTDSGSGGGGTNKLEGA